MFVMNVKILFSVKSPLGLLTEKVISKHFLKKSVIKNALFLKMFLPILVKILKKMSKLFRKKYIFVKTFF